MGGLRLMGLADAEAIAPEGVIPVPYQITQVPDGTAGVRATLNLMVAIVVDYRMSPTVRELAQSIIGGCPNRNRLCQAEAVQGWVRDSINYVPDVRDVETLQTPDYTIRMGSGDCDDQSMLVAALLESIGFETRFCAIGRNGGPYSHVSAQVHLGKGWLNAETILPRLPAPWRDWPQGSPLPLGWFPPDATSTLLARVP